MLSLKVVVEQKGTLGFPHPTLFLQFTDSVYLKGQEEEIILLLGN